MNLKISSDNKKIEYTLDQGMYCKIDNPVFIFENGKFPVKNTFPWNREKLGLMIELINDTISGITFCGLFVHEENQYLFEKKGKKSK